MMQKMFLRFYDQSEENINKCIEELKNCTKGIIKVEKEPLKISCNPILPSGNHTQVWLTFDSKKHLDDFYKNTKTRDIYLKYSSGKSIPYAKTFERREPGDTVFGV